MSHKRKLIRHFHPKTLAPIFLRVQCSETHHGEWQNPTAPYNLGSGRAPKTQSSYIGKHALARYRTRLSKTWRPRLLSSSRFARMVGGKSQALLIRAKDVKRENMRPKHLAFRPMGTVCHIGAFRRSLPQQRCRNTAVLLLALFAIAGILASSPARRPLIIWNASQSAPLGLYQVFAGCPTRGQLALIRLTNHWSSFANHRGYLPHNVYLLKPLSAISGEWVCRFGSRVFLRDQIVRARPSDLFGRLLPIWQGCHKLSAGELFFLARPSGSFDSRYFGPILSSQVVGTALLIRAAQPK